MAIKILRKWERGSSPIKIKSNKRTRCIVVEYKNYIEAIMADKEHFEELLTWRYDEWKDYLTKGKEVVYGTGSSGCDN